MQSVLLTSSSNFGKYLATNSKNQPTYKNTTTDKTTSLITLKQNYIHEHPFMLCKLDISGTKLYLVDIANHLIYLNLLDNSYSTLKNHHKNLSQSSTKVTNFTIDGNNNLSLLYVSDKSQLFRVCFDTKKPQKIINLNMGKIVAFQRNYLRQMVLVLDYKVLFLYDVTKKINNTKNKIKSLKAGYNQVFTNACFASNNRFIILAVKNIEIRILQIMNLETVHKIRLPFCIQNLKIEVSYNGKIIAIYGNSNIIFFITFPGVNKAGSTTQNNQPNYQLIQIPFLASISQLKYTGNDTLLLLGNDQVLYGIRECKMDRAVPIFNQEYQLRMMTFDISLNSEKIVLISHRNVYQLSYHKGVDEAIRIKQQEQGCWKQIQHRVEGLQNTNNEQNRNSKIEMKQIRQDVLQQQLNSHQFQYEDEDESQDDIQQKQNESQIRINTAILMNTDKLPKYTEAPLPINPALHEQISLSEAQKKQLNHIFIHLCSRYRDICLGQNNNIVKLLLNLNHKLNGNYVHCLGVLDLIFRNLSTEYDKLQHYALILCPEIVSLVQRKYQTNFGIFYKDICTTLAMHYFSSKEWNKVINWVIKEHELSCSVPVFVIAMLKNIMAIVSNKQQWDQLVKPSAQKLQTYGLCFEQIVRTVDKIYSNPEYKNLLNFKNINQLQMIDISSKISKGSKSYEYNAMAVAQQPAFSVLRQQQAILNNIKLEQLIIKQQSIKKQLNRYQKQKPHFIH